MKPLALLSLIALAACAPDRPASSPDADGVSVADEAPRGVEQIVITTTDGRGDLGLTDEVLFFRLSDKARAEAEATLAQETEDLEGIGGSIARSVTGAVADALDFTVSVPVDQIDDVRHNDGRLVIETGDDTFGFDPDRPDGEGPRFDPADAERLVEAFDRVKG